MPAGHMQKASAPEAQQGSAPGAQKATASGAQEATASGAQKAAASGANVQADRRALLRIVDDGFEEAALLAGGAIEQQFLIGGQIVRLRFAGDALVHSLTRALAHLRTESTATAALTLDIWDSGSTGRPLPL